MGARSCARSPASGVDSFQVDVQHVPGQGTTFDVLAKSGALRSESFVAESDDRGPPHRWACRRPRRGVRPRHRRVTQGGRPPDHGHLRQPQGQVSARFWVDDATGLLLRRTLYVDGRLVRWSGYTSIRMMRHGFMKHLPPELQEPPNTALSTSIAPALNDKGWTCPQRLTAGFRLQQLLPGSTPAAVSCTRSTPTGCPRSPCSSSAARWTRRRWPDSGCTKARGNRSTSGRVCRRPWCGSRATRSSPSSPMLPEQMLGGLVSRLPHGVGQPALRGGDPHRRGLSRLASAVSP